MGGRRGGVIALSVIYLLFLKILDGGMEAGLNNGQPPVDDGASGATASGDGSQAAAAAVAAAGIVSQPSRKRARSDDSVSNMTDSCDSAASGIKRIKV